MLELAHVYMHRCAKFRYVRFVLRLLRSSLVFVALLLVCVLAQTTTMANGNVTMSIDSEGIAVINLGGDGKQEWGTNRYTRTYKQCHNSAHT